VESCSRRVELFELYDGARVYAAVSRRDEFIIGDAAGYIRALGTDGTYRWQHFTGSSVGAIDISADGLKLSVSTAAGFLSIIRLDAGRQQSYQIGNGNHLEERRWILWRGTNAANLVTLKLLGGRSTTAPAP
jgi:hypothetical protein